LCIKNHGTSKQRKHNIPGESSGADREVKFAEGIGRPIFYSVKEAIEYYKNLGKL